MLDVKNTTQILDLATSKKLYVALIVQLNKDFQLSNIEECISEKIPPDELKTRLYNSVSTLVTDQFDDFLNLLYRIDLPEQCAVKLDDQSTEDYIENVSYLILKREWQKVWLKQNYSS